MGMDFLKIMQRVQDIQKKGGAMLEELANIDISSESGGGAVKVVCDGLGKFKSIKIAPSAINSENPSAVDAETIEMLEDLVSSAMIEANEKAAKLMEEKKTQIMGGIKIPGLNL